MASFDLAERFQTPVFVLSDLDIGMNDWMIPKLTWDDSYRPDRGKVLSAEQLESVKLIKREADRAVAVIRDLRIFSRKTGPRHLAVDVNALVEQTVRLRSYGLRANGIEVELDGHEPVRFLPLLPMTPNEAAWKRVHGAQALEQRWLERGTDLRDPRRAEVDMRAP